MEKPKLLHISTARSWRGGEQQIAYLVKELQAVDWPQAIACIRDAPLHKWALEQGIQVFPLKKRSSLDLSFSYFLANKAFKKEGFKLWHAHDAHAHGFAVYAQSIFGAKAELLVSRRVDFPVARSWLSRFKYNYRGVKKYLAVSHAIAEILRRSLRFPEKVHTVHSAVDPSKIKRAERGKLRTEFSHLKDKFWICNVGALVGHKDQVTFLRTAAELIKSGDDLHFFIVGSGEKEAELKALTNQLSLNEQISFLGFRADVPTILKDCDCFLFTSEMEGLGTSILDAFAAELPVVATAAGGIPEMVIDGETGLLAPVKDSMQLAQAVLKIRSDLAFAEKLKRGALAKLEEFSPQQMAQSTIQQYLS